MTPQEMVTTFPVRDTTTPHDICVALDAHLTARGIKPEEYGFSETGRLDDDWHTRPLPSYRWLVAFAVEGTSEGYYVHIGAIVRPQSRHDPATYRDLGFCKTYSAENAYAIAREASRFLTAAQWN